MSESCPHCDEVFSNGHELVDHLSDAGMYEGAVRGRPLPGERPNTESPPETCLECGIHIGAPDKLADHLTDAHDIFTYVTDGGRN